MQDQLIQYMDEFGNCEYKKHDFLTLERVLEMYRLMVLTRTWNYKALNLQRQGRMGTLASVRGQEASNIGMGMALARDDWFVPAFREYGVLFALGVSMKDQFIYWGGDERGGRVPESINCANVCITVGAHLCHAVGIALASKIKKERKAVLSSSGDGSTSEGDFHEALNCAAVYKVPVVFAIQNNQWAISTPFYKQTATKTISEKASAYGMQGFRVDGNDVFAVYDTVKKALDLAKETNSPSLIELVTYRLDDHTTADDATRYRTAEEVAVFEKRCPIVRLNKFLSTNFGWNEAKEKELQDKCSEEVEEAVREFESADPPRADSIFDNIYSERPWNLVEQAEEVSAFNRAEEKNHG